MPLLPAMGLFRTVLRRTIYDYKGSAHFKLSYPAGNANYWEMDVESNESKSKLATALGALATHDYYDHGAWELIKELAPHLTIQERKMLAMRIEHKTIREIANNLNKQDGAVKSALGRIYEKARKIEKSGLITRPEL